MTWVGYIGYVVSTIIVYVFFDNLAIYGMEDAIEEITPALLMIATPLLLVDQVIRAFKNGNKAKMTWVDYIGYVVAAIIVYAFFDNLDLYGMEDAIEETAPALLMISIPLLLVDQIIRAFKDGNIAKAGKMALGIVVSAVLLFVHF